MEQASNISDMMTTNFINTRNYSGALEFINTLQEIMDMDI